MIRRTANVFTTAAASAAAAFITLNAGAARTADGGEVRPPLLPTAAPAPAPSSYLLAPGDVLDVSVSNFPELSCRPEVQPDGTAALPLLGQVALGGKTAAQVAALLTEHWKKYVVRPAVVVGISQRRAAAVTFYGFAARPGALPFREGLRLTEALALVGGVSPAGDETKLLILRRSGRRLDADVSQPEAIAGTDRDPLLEEGDLVFVPEKPPIQVSVLGEVGRPGSLEFKEGMSVLDAVTASNGVRETADLVRATLLRDGKETPLDLDALLRRGDVALNQKLRPGDRLMVPELRNRTYIFGAVGRPGHYPYKEGDRLLDALNASGLQPNANLTNVRLVRIAPDKNSGRVTEVNLEKFLKNGDMAGNVPLQPGDVVFLAEKGRKFGMQDLLGILSGLTLVNQAASLFGGIGR